MYKILSGTRPDYLSDLLKIKKCGYNFIDSENVLDLPRFKYVTHGKNSFKYIAVKIWNDLPPCFRLCENFKNFKLMLNT